MSAFDRDVSDELTDLELLMLQGIDKMWEQWEDTGFAGPMPGPLLRLITEAHGALMKRAARLAKDEMLEWGPPEAALIRLKKVEQALIKRIEQKNRMTVQ
jgi:hypothetical protein